MNQEGLSQTLQQLLQVDAPRNPAFNRLMLDYSNYHGLFVLLGTPTTILIGLTAFFAWRNVARIRGQAGRRTEVRMNALLGSVNTATGLFMGLGLVANASNVLNPLKGFSLLVATLPSAQVGSELERLRLSFSLWMSTEALALPEVVKDHVQQRLAWQQPKAFVCGLLLLLLSTFLVRFWSVMTTAHQGTSLAQLDVKAHLWTGLGVVAILCLPILTVMFIANAQAAFAPITITLLYG